MRLTVVKDIIADANMLKAIERTTVLAKIKKVKVSKTQVKLKTIDMFLQLSVLKTQLLKSDFIKKWKYCCTSLEIFTVYKW